MLGTVMELIRSGVGAVQSRDLQSGIPVLVNLRPFDVAIQLSNSTVVNTFTLQNVVATWMEDGFRDVIDRLGSNRFSPFEQVFLTFQESRRSLRGPAEERLLTELFVSERNLQSTFLASYSGVSVWTTSEGTTVPSEGLVASIQLETIRTADTVLLDSLRDPSLDVAGLGSAVEDVRAQISGFDDGGGSGDGGNDDLDVVIIVAIVVACLAFALLGVTLYLAYRRNAQQQDAYKVGSPRRQVNGAPGEQATREVERSNGKPPENINGTGYAVSDLGAPSTDGDNADGEELGGGLYPESLISEDISTSLTAYYRGGMGSKNSLPLNNAKDINDAASISSMESYGYSLDGFQSIAGGTQQDSFLNAPEKTPSLEDAEEQMDVPAREFQDPPKDPKGDVIEM